MQLLSLHLCVHAALALHSSCAPTTQMRHAGRSRRVVASALEWEDVAGCKLLRPAGSPRGLVHFTGGVFVSPSPDVAYRYLLESLSARGYAVLATPFVVDFDYKLPAADIYTKYSVSTAVGYVLTGPEGTCTVCAQTRTHLGTHRHTDS